MAESRSLPRADCLVIATGPERPFPDWPRAQLMRDRQTDEVFCRCPYACVATSERCEFDGKYDAQGRPVPWEPLPGGHRYYD